MKKMRAASVRVDRCPACKKPHTPNMFLLPIADGPEEGETHWYHCGPTGSNVPIDLAKPELYQNQPYEPGVLRFHGE